MMFGLDTTQLIVLGAAAVLLLVTNNPFASAMSWAKDLFSGFSSPDSMLETIIREVYSCGECTAEEEKKIEEAISILVSHFVRHRLKGDQK